MYEQSLHGLFSEEAATKEVAFMDGYLATPSSHIDIDLTLRYCVDLAQLTAFLEKSKTRYLKLACALRFRITLHKAGDWTTTCHIAELLTRLLRLGSLCSDPLLVSIPHRQLKKPELITTGMSTLSASALATYFEQIRKSIGLLRYTMLQVMPKAVYLVDLMNEKSSGFANSISSHYTTLRVLGCWIAAAIAFQSNSGSQAGVQHLMECASIADEAKVPPSALALFLRNSAIYEVDLRRADYFESIGESPTSSIVRSLKKRAHDRENAPVSADPMPDITRYWDNALIDSTLAARSPIKINANALLNGEDVLKDACFV